MSEPALKCENNANFKQIYTQKLFFPFKFPFFAVLVLGEI